MTSIASGCFSYAPSGLGSLLAFYPRLTPWALCFRRFAVGGAGIQRRHLFPFPLFCLGQKVNWNEAVRFDFAIEDKTGKFQVSR